MFTFHGINDCCFELFSGRDLSISQKGWLLLGVERELAGSITALSTSFPADLPQGGDPAGSLPGRTLTSTRRSSLGTWQVVKTLAPTRRVVLSERAPAFQRVALSQPRSSYQAAGYLNVLNIIF